MKKEAIIITGASLIIGIGEALLYYNLGQSQGGKFSFKIPPRTETFKTIGIVLVTSVLTAVLTNGIQNMMKLKKEENQKSV